jgi:hypothetical protein
MQRSYFALQYLLNGRVQYLLWYGSDVDGVVTDSDGTVPSFQSLEALRAYARSRGLEIKDETPKLHDLDSTESWIEMGDATSIDCENILSTWNLLADVSRSVAGNFDGDPDETDAVYERLFLGGDTANEVLRPKDEPIFRPRFSEAETTVMRKTLKAGLAMLRGAVQPPNSEKDAE